jgi:hypothetical protein
MPFSTELAPFFLVKPLDELMITPEMKISDVLLNPTGTLVIQMLLARSYVVYGTDACLSAMILPRGIDRLLTDGDEVMLFNVMEPPVNNRKSPSADNCPLTFVVIFSHKDVEVLVVLPKFVNELCVNKHGLGFTVSVPFTYVIA